jgi:hypothetical protein
MRSVVAVVGDVDADSCAALATAVAQARTDRG